MCIIISGKIPTQKAMFVPAMHNNPDYKCIVYVYSIPDVSKASSCTCLRLWGAPPILCTVSRMNWRVAVSSSIGRVTPAMSNRYCHSGVR